MSELNDPRVLFAAERTLLAWNRTSLGLMAFGFVLERSTFLMALYSRLPADSTVIPILFWAGMAFILLAVFALIYSSRQFIATRSTLSASEVPKGYTTSGGLILNACVAVLGLILAAGLYISHA